MIESCKPLILIWQNTLSQLYKFLPIWQPGIHKQEEKYALGITPSMYKDGHLQKAHQKETVLKNEIHGTSVNLLTIRKKVNKRKVKYCKEGVG